MNIRRPVAPLAVAIIAGVTTFLLFRLSHRQPTPVAPVVAISPTPPASLLPAILPVIDEAHAPPVKWKSKISGSVPSPLWKIAFENYDSNSGRTDLWIANGDGSGTHRLLADAQSPCWSPQHRILAFARGGNVWVANADGSNARPVTFWPTTTDNDSSVTIYGISWNAHDNVLSFARDETYHLTNIEGGKPESVRGSTIYHVALKPSKSARATAATPFAPGAYETPTSSGDTGNRDIWRRTPPRFDLTEHHGHFNFAENEYPAWSPSGKKLAFVREGDVWLAEGEEEQEESERGYAQDWTVSRIAASASYDGHTVGASHWIVAATGVSWSHDENWLVYGAQRISGSGQNDLHILRRRESGWQDTLLKLPGDSPSISPDGHWILYTYQGTLYAMTPDLKQRITLLKNNKTIWCNRPAW